jgi:hypothetical protein
MKHLADYIQILPLTDFDSFNGTTLISKSGADPDRLIANNRLVFDPKPESSAAGPFYTESLKVVVDKLTDDQRTNYTSRRPVVVLLFDDTGTPVLWGDAEQKVRVTITPNTDYDILDLVRKTTTALF